MTPRAHIWLALLWLGTAGLCAASCQTAARRRTDVKTVAKDTTRLQQLRQRVVWEIRKPTCSERLQCRAIPLGAKPCGGPWSYAVYSTATTDSAALAVAVERYNTEDAELNRELGRVSDCNFVSPPTVECVAGLCSPSVFDKSSPR